MPLLGMYHFPHCDPYKDAQTTHLPRPYYIVKYHQWYAFRIALTKLSAFVFNFQRT